jgi:hypothetical protein
VLLDVGDEARGTDAQRADAEAVGLELLTGGSASGVEGRRRHDARPARLRGADRGRRGDDEDAEGMIHTMAKQATPARGTMLVRPL